MSQKRFTVVQARSSSGWRMHHADRERIIALSTGWTKNEGECQQALVAKPGAVFDVEWPRTPGSSVHVRTLVIVTAADLEEDPA